MKCTECGKLFTPRDAWEEICLACQIADVPEAHFVFPNCNVCGIKLRTKEEDRMGMCERCAAE